MLGVPDVGAIFVITFFGAYVPYIGATIAGFVAVMLAAADGGIARGVAVLTVVIIVQVLEGNYNAMQGVCPWWDQMKAQQKAG